MLSEPSTHIHQASADAYSIRKILVAHDLSVSADLALADAQVLAGHFDSDLVIAHIQPEGTDIPAPLVQAHVRLHELTATLTKAGYRSRAVIRKGTEASTIAQIVAEERPDLLMLGAYGHGSQIRETLGSTAERLLRSIPCPVLTYGPNVSRTLTQSGNGVSILLAIELPFNPVYLEFAVDVAALFRARLEVLHVVDTGHTLSFPHAYQDAQFACEEIGRHLEAGRAHVSASLLFGHPPDAIASRSKELNCSLIIIPLDTRRYLSSKTSDNVAAKVIRKADVPVMTYRFDL